MSEVPPVSIDEAIELFLAITCPGGVPEGVDREVLVSKLRERIAADRPEWAAASAPPATVAPPTPEVSYAQRKAAAVERARQAEIPSDPEERYFEERRQEARRNRELRDKEAEDAATRQRLIQRFMTEKRAAGTAPEHALGLSRSEADGAEVPSPELDEETLQRALRIRKLLVERMERSRSIEIDAPAVLELGLERPAASRPAITDEVREPRAPAPSTWREVAEVARDLSPDEQARVVRGFNESRRAGLKQREDLLAERRSKREDLWAERRPRREDLLAERRPRREDLLAERRPRREDLLAERRPQREDLLAERRPQREDLLAERRLQREDLLAERRPRREDLLAERRPQREDLLAERRPSRAGAAAAAERTERASASGLRIDEEPRTRSVDSGRLRVE
ncbi:MAG TPA: hypothetical protein VNO30_38420 [Kofleriaceae bacterium]|nr:hypothetical protein [Kofleriaceae bacterium]